MGPGRLREVRGSRWVRGRGGRVAIWISLGAAAMLAAPSACLFPSYSFDEPEASGGGGTRATSSGGGMTSTGMNPEDCGNGADDDGDGAIDCDDPKCTDHACVPEVPTGWAGYFALYDGAPAGDPGCPAMFPSKSHPQYLGNSEIHARPASCTCSCGAAQGQACAPLDTLLISTGDGACDQAMFCTGNLPVPAGWNGACYNPDYFPGGMLTCGPTASETCDTTTNAPCNVSVTASALAATGGACSVGPVTAHRPYVTWGKLGRACGDSGQVGAGCNLGQVCLPRPPEDFEPGVCISKEGDNPCPAGAFTDKHVFYTDVMDTRGCMDDCSCSPPSGGSCPTTITIYSSPSLGSCSSPVAQFPAGTCVEVAGNPNLAGRTASPPGDPTGGTCNASGGMPTGAATPISPTTFCCIQ